MSFIEIMIVVALISLHFWTLDKNNGGKNGN